MACAELQQTVDAARSLIDALARHPNAIEAMDAVDEIGAHAMTRMETLNDEARLQRAKRENH